MDHDITLYKHNSTNLYGFCDADRGGCPFTRRSTTGFCIFIGANCISQYSRKQPTIAQSSLKAEYRAMTSTIAELTWIIYILRDISIPLLNTPQLYYDNMSAFYIPVNHVFHARTKHIELDYHFVGEKVVLGLLITKYVTSKQQLADILTKPLTKAVFNHYLKSEKG